MAAAFELHLGRQNVEYRCPLMKEGEVSPCKILTCLLIREYFTHSELRPTQPTIRIAAANLFYRLISVKDFIIYLYPESFTRQ